MKLVLWSLFALLCLFGPSCCDADTSCENKTVVCYYGSWANYRPGRGAFKPEDIDPRLCTHLVYTFVGLTKAGEVSILDSWMDLPSGLDGYNRTLTLRKQNPNLKVLIGLGGYNVGTEAFSYVANSSALRKTFAKNVANFTAQYGFQGCDLDWEYPVAADKDNFVELLKELRAELSNLNLLLTAAVTINPDKIDAGYNVPEIMQYLDLVNLMAYDMHGSWDSVTGMNAPLCPLVNDSTPEFNVKSAIQNWLDRGANASKMVLGVPLYGRTFTLTNSSDNGVGAAASGAGTAGIYTQEAGNLGFNEICLAQTQNNTFAEIWFDAQKVPYAYQGDQWVSYDNERSIAIKSELVEPYGLAGIMVWSIETDDFHGDCGRGKYPLLTTISNVLNGKDTSTSTGTTTGTPPTPRPTLPTTQPPRPTQPPQHTCKRVGFVRDSTDCAVFYRCLFVGQPLHWYTFRCPNGLYFDENLQVCNWPSQVQCP